MKKEQNDVREFMQKVGQDNYTKPCADPGMKAFLLRRNLMEEELLELVEGMKHNDLIEIADGLADLMYVVLGTAVAYGIEMQPIWDEVHRSNMSKFIDGHKDWNGKWIKGPSYSPADLLPILKAQEKPSSHSQACETCNPSAQPEPHQAPSPSVDSPSTS